MSNPNRPDKLRLDALVQGHAVVAGKLFAPEISLITTKWPAYRFMSPLKATKLFGLQYRGAYKRCIERHFDREHAQRTQPLAHLDFTTNNKFLTQLWVARQHADRFFVPYEEYLDFCFEFWMRRDRNRPPRPNQLRPSTPEQTVAWEAEFGKFWTTDRMNIALNRMEPMAQYADHEQKGLPALSSYKEALLKLVREDDVNLNGFVATHIVRRRHVSTHDLMSVFPEDAIASAVATAEHDLRLLGQAPHEYARIQKVDNWQACCGVLSAAAGEASQCRGCGQHELCAKLRDLVGRELVKAHGSLDPVLEKRRCKQREDTARSRAKAKAAKDAEVAMTV